MKAYSLIRRGPEYRSDAFAAGLRASGYKYVEGWHGNTPGRDDVLISWNRYGLGDAAAEIFERAGARVLIAENGYIGRDGDGQQLYALALNHHNGAGHWHVGQADRWAALGIDLQPWRVSGEHILVCAQRGIGPKGVAMPPNWEHETVAKLLALTKRPVRLRPHPETRGLAVKPPPLEQDLENCHAVVVWGSGAGIRALVEGVPVIHEMPNWIGRAACGDIQIDQIEAPRSLGAREAMLRALAWAQWTLAEIAAGLPFKYLLQTPAICCPAAAPTLSGAGA